MRVFSFVAVTGVVIASALLLLLLLLMLLQHVTLAWVLHDDYDVDDAAASFLGGTKSFSQKICNFYLPWLLAAVCLYLVPVPPPPPTPSSHFDRVAQIYSTYAACIHLQE